MSRDLSPEHAQETEGGRSNDELLRSNARLYVLAEVSNAFAMVATDYGALLEKIVRTTAELVGDGCLVTLVDADGERLVNAANAHRDPAREVDYRAYLAGVGAPKLTSASVAAGVIRTGIAKLVPAVEPEMLVAQSDDALKPLVARLDVHSFAVVPIRARQTIIGTLSLLRSGPGRDYTTDDLTLLQDLADRAGLAIDNARLYDDLERRVRQRTAELEDANRELEAFSYSAAHDLRAPLRWIDGFAGALLEDYGDRLGEEGRADVDRIRAAGKRMSSLIEDMMALAQISRASLQRQRADLSGIAAAIVEELRQREPDRQVAVEIAPGLEAEADAALVTIALQNLLANAWKFTGKRPDARIELGQAPLPAGPAFFVRDNGAGFDMAHAAKLFQPFHRLHGVAEFEGTGIGLATVHRIVSRHGGQTWAQSAPGAGATFFFTLG